MIVTVKTSRGERRVRLPTGALASDALASMELALTHHLVLRRGAPIPSDEPLAHRDVIDVVEVFSGG
jgi:sulfur carrier protein ThiS